MKFLNLFCLPRTFSVSKYFKIVLRGQKRIQVITLLLHCNQCEYNSFKNLHNNNNKTKNKYFLELWINFHDLQFITFQT